MFCLTDFVQGLSYKGVQDRQVSVVIFFSYIFFFALLLVWVTLSVVIKIIIIINKFYILGGQQI